MEWPSFPGNPSLSRRHRHSPEESHYMFSLSMNQIRGMLKEDVDDNGNVKDYFNHISI